MLDPFFFYNRGRTFAAGKHIRENFLALFAANLSALDQVDQLVECFRRNWTVIDCLACRAQRALQIVQDPVGDVLWFFRTFGGGFEITRKIDIVRQDARVIRGDLILLDETRAFRLRQFRNARARLRQQHFALYRDQIRIRKISIIMGRFLGPHEKCFTSGVVPATGLLLQFFAAFERFGLSLNFKRKRASNSTNRVHVLDLDFRAELRLLFRPHRNVAVAAQLPFLHIGIADSAVNQNLFERREKGERLLRRTDLWLRHDFHQRRAGAVEIDAGARLKMETLGHILLKVNADEVHFLIRSRDVFLRILRISEIVQRDTAVCAKRHVVLRDLIILRHIRIEIIFPVELRD